MLKNSNETFIEIYEEKKNKKKGKKTGKSRIERSKVLSYLVPKTEIPQEILNYYCKNQERLNLKDFLDL
jgi:hypothetical protein